MASAETTPTPLTTTADKDQAPVAAAKSPAPTPTPPTSASKTPEPPKPEATKENKDPKKESKDPKKEETKASASPAGAEAKKEAGTSEDGSRPGTPKGPTLREQFRVFSKFGDIKSDGKLLTLSQSDKWMKQAKVIDGKTITTTDTAIAFKKFKQMKIAFPDYEKYLDELAKYKKQDVSAIKDKMKNSGTPATRGTTSVVKNSAVDRLTNSKSYTGSHRERFDKEGKGRGTVGRKEVADKSGYVAGYKNKNSYDKTH